MRLAPLALVPTTPPRGPDRRPGHHTGSNPPQHSPSQHSSTPLRQFMHTNIA